jgi:hypothetical protein
MATIPTDAPSNHNLNLPPIPPPLTVFPRASTTPDVPDTVLPASTDENRDEGICPQPPLPSVARIFKPILKTIPKPWPTMKPMRPYNFVSSAQSEAGSSSSDVSNDGQESNPISLTTPIDPLMQNDNADPKIMPNADVSNPATMNDPTIDAPLLPQFGILPSSDQLSSTNTTINTFPVSPSSSLPEANTTLPTSGPIIIPTPNLSSTSSNVPEVAHISVISPSLPQHHAVTSDDSNGPLNSDSGDAVRASDPTVQI